MKKWKFINLFIIVAFMIVNLVPAKSYAGSWNGWIYQNPYPTSQDLYDVKFITPMLGWMTGKNGIILYTKDGGDTWSEQENRPGGELNLPGYRHIHPLVDRINRIDLEVADPRLDHEIIRLVPHEHPERVLDDAVLGLAVEAVALPLVIRIIRVSGKPERIRLSF